MEREERIGMTQMEMVGLVDELVILQTVEIMQRVVGGRRYRRELWW